MLAASEGSRVILILARSDDSTEGQASALVVSSTDEDRILVRVHPGFEVVDDRVVHHDLMEMPNEIV